MSGSNAKKGSAREEIQNTVFTATSQIRAHIDVTRARVASVVRDRK